MSERDCRVIPDTVTKDGGTIEEMRQELHRQRFVVASRLELAIKSTGMVSYGGAAYGGLVAAVRVVIRDLRAGKV